MKINRKKLINLTLSVFAGTLFLFASTEAHAQANLSRAITAHIGKTGEGGSEYKKDRKIVFGDVDGDGVKDAVVQYTLEGAGGGNSWGQQLAVFLKKKGVYRAAADETVGGKFFRSFTLQKVVDRQIVGATETCPDREPQGMCKNPAKGQMKFALAGGKLTEQ